MRQLRIICVGKIKQAHRYLVQGIAEYEKRLSPVFKIDWIEVPEKPPFDESPAALDHLKEEEAKQIERFLLPRATVLLLSERGETPDSKAFSMMLFSDSPPSGGPEVSGSGPIIVIIGGAFGTAPRLTDMAHRVIALSRLTFPHQLVRLILLEQCYRAWMIHQNKPYHK
jgi:23S rRNA (pseudouridine1915-N3)-methyltransferase